MKTLALTFAALVAGLHLVMAVSIYLDAKHYESEGRTLYFIGPAVWGTITFMTGLFGMLCYWFMHHSGLSRKW